jgi:hydroxyacylglutathione hydrolase
MNIKHLVLGPVNTNTYILSVDNKAIVIDPSFGFSTIKEALIGKEVVACLLTHGHYDHIASIELLKKEYPKAPIYIHEKEEHFLRDPEYNLSLYLMNETFSYKGEVSTLKDHDKLEILGHECQVLHTPGHSYGSVSYYIPSQKIIFTGDLLFKNSIGRSDFPTSNFEELLSSVKKRIFTLPQETLVYPGHNEFTTVLDEKNNNVFFK